MGFEYFLIIMVCLWVFLRINSDSSTQPTEERTVVDLLKSIENKLECLILICREQEQSNEKMEK